MKRFEFSDDMWYNKKNKMKSHIKFFMVCSLSAVCAASVVVGTTVLAVHHNNYSGRGGPDVSGFTSSAAEVIASLAEPQADDLTQYFSSITEDSSSVVSEDRELYYTTYRVKSGDMISRIASNYGVTQDSIISVNSIKSSRTIQPGQLLKIPSMAGIMYTVKETNETIASISEKYEVDAKKCALANGLDIEKLLTPGTSIFITDAKLDRMALAEINGDMFRLPLRASWYLTSRWGWRPDPFGSGRRTYHGGIDMACPQGTSIYAAQVGTVVTAGWSNVYGNYVIISHGKTGYQTLYGHMVSAPFVKKGQVVTTDTIIGRVGSTGQSTGPHLHFTVYKNGRSIDPLNMLPARK